MFHGSGLSHPPKVGLLALLGVQVAGCPLVGGFAYASASGTSLARAYCSRNPGFVGFCCVLGFRVFQVLDMLLILRISASSAFSAFVSSRSCARCPPCQALRDAVALPSGVRGPVLCFHGCHCRISSA